MRLSIIGMPFGMPIVGEMIAAARGVLASRAAEVSGRGGPRRP